MTGLEMKALDGDDPRQLGGYRLLRRLATGGMGRIYLARSMADGSLVAVKTLLAEGVVSDIHRRRFAREVTLARRIDSAYTARVRDADPDAERPWMAIEYIPAPALSELVRSAGRLPGPAVCWIAAGTAQALVTLHDADIVHRDVKPQNILLPLAGPRLIDFGISHANDITRTSLTLGTIAFTSPEQAQGQPSTTASDVYSLGATLFHIAVGHPPYPDTDDTIRLLTLVQRGELDLTGLPEGLAPLIRPCLAIDPGDRPDPVEVVRHSLAELDGFPTPRRGGHWLPPLWTALIEEYEAQGRALSEGGGEGGSGGRKRVAAKARATAQNKEKELRERAERERQKGSEQVRRQQAARASAQTSPTSASRPSPAARTAGFSAGGCFWAVMAFIAFVVFIWQPWNGDDMTGSTGSTSGSTSGSSSSGTDTSGGTGSTATSGTDTAFVSVRSGDCLDAYQDGYGSWSRPAPLRVGCGAVNAYLRVLGVTESGSCASHGGRASWRHTGEENSSLTLCVERKFRKGQCFLAKAGGGHPGSANLLTLWNCSADKVPREFNYIMQVTAVMRASAGTGACPSEPGRYRYSWDVYGGEAMICAKIA